MHQPSLLLARAAGGLALVVTGLHGAVITWQFDYQGWSPEARDAMEAVAGYISTQIQPVADMTIKVATGTTTPTGFLATTSPRFSSVPSAFNVTAAQAAIQGAVLVPGYHATINADLNQPWGFGDQVTAGQFDFRDVMLHELTHALGVSGLVGADGTSLAGQTRYSTFDQYVLGWNGSAYAPLIERNAQGAPVGPAAFAPAALIDTAHPLLFSGPFTLAQQGGPVALVTVNPFQPGSSIYHLAEPGDLLFSSMGPGDRPGVYSDLHRAVLADLGYTVVPEPPVSATVVLLVASSAWLWRRRTTDARHSAPRSPR